MLKGPKTKQYVVVVKKGFGFMQQFRLLTFFDIIEFISECWDVSAPGILNYTIAMVLMLIEFRVL